MLGEFVAYTAHGLDVARVLGIGFYLPAYALDVYVRRAGFTIEVTVPELLHYLLPTIDPPGMGRKKTQDLKLCGGEIDPLAVDPDLSAREIYHEARKLVFQARGSGVQAATTQVGSHATNHLRWAGRFRNVVVGSHF